MNIEALRNESRLLMEVNLKPLQGDRFQPTGFPDLGPARFTAPDGTEMILVESPQSVANRMEMACWDSSKRDLIEQLQGLPYIRVYDKDGKRITNSILEAHRINSEYIMKNAHKIISQNDKPEIDKRSFNDEFSEEISYKKDGQVDWDKFYKALFKYDPNSLIHGVFLEEIGGRLRITRALSGFIEAIDVGVAENGGVKHNIVQPELKGGEGNVPFHRTEFTAKNILAYFTLDITLLSSYNLPDESVDLLIGLSLYKIRRFLSTGLRLRTACDLEPAGEIIIKRPKDFSLPPEDELLENCNSLIARCKTHFADPWITEVQWQKSVA